MATTTLSKLLADACHHPDCPEWLIDAICEALNVHGSAEPCTAAWFAVMLDVPAKRQPADVLDAALLHEGGVR